MIKVYRVWFWYNKTSQTRVPTSESAGGERNAETVGDHTADIASVRRKCEELGDEDGGGRREVLLHARHETVLVEGRPGQAKTPSYEGRRPWISLPSLYKEGIS